MDSKEINIDNALLVIDESLSELDKSKSGSLYKISPQLLENKNLMSFHFKNFKNFCIPKFFIPATYYKLTGNVLPFFKSSLDFRQRTYNSKTNEVKFSNFEKMIKNGKFYTNDVIKSFYDRSSITKYANAVIGENQKLLLKEIFHVFKVHNLFVAF